MGKAVGILALFFSLLIPLSAQENVVVVESMTGTQLYADPNGNIYLVSGSKLSKLAADGTLLRSYDDSFFGNICSVDVDNPMKIMVFYNESGKIVFLDDRLTPIMEPLDLFANGYSSVHLAAYSTDNLIWLYDNFSQELVCVDFYLKEKLRNNLNVSEFRPSQLLACQEQALLMNNPNDGIYLFDAFGTLVKRIPINMENIMGYSKGRISYVTTDEIGEYDHLSMTDKRWSIPAGSTCAVRVGKKLYYLDGKFRLTIIE